MEYMCTQTRPRFILSSGGTESKPVLTPREKSPLPEAQRRAEPATLHQAIQRAQQTTDWPIPASSYIMKTKEPDIK